MTMMYYARNASRGTRSTKRHRQPLPGVATSERLGPRIHSAGSAPKKHSNAPHNLFHAVPHRRVDCQSEAEGWFLVFFLFKQGGLLAAVQCCTRDDEVRMRTRWDPRALVKCKRTWRTEPLMLHSAGRTWPCARVMRCSDAALEA